MRSTHAEKEQERIDFAKRAAEWFKANPQGATFGDVSPGSLLALRWGLGNDCVLVVRLDEYETPVNFQQLIRNIKT